MRRSTQSMFAVLVVFSYCIGGAKAAPVISADRMPTNAVNPNTPWKGLVGVVGGIPNNATVFASHTTSDSQATIESSVANCTDDQVVSLAAGTYNFSSTFNIANSRTTVRGATNASGDPTTVFNFTADADPLVVIGSGDRGGNWFVGDMSGYTTRTISSGATRGSHSIVVTATPTGLAANQWMALSCDGFLGSGFSDMNGRPSSQIVWVTNVSGTTIEFYDPIQADHWTGTLQVHYQSAANTIQLAGLENVKVTRSGSTVNGYSVELIGTRECWLKNVEIDTAGPGEMLLSLYATYRSEIRDCNIHGFSDLSVDSSTAYGTRIVQSTATLYINNRVYDVPNAIAMFGANLTAIYGLYSTNYPYDSSPGFLSQIIFNHASHNMYNLVEHSVFGRSYHDLDNPGSHGMVYHGNWIPGADGSDGGKDNDVLVGAWGSGVTTTFTNKNWSIVGNILGKSGAQSTYDDLGSGVNDADGIYRIDSGSSNSMVRFDNYDFVTVGIKSTEALGSLTRQTSYLMESNELGHPIYGTNGPFDSHNISTVTATNIQAGYKFRFGTNFSGAAAAGSTYRNKGKSRAGGFSPVF